MSAQTEEIKQISKNMEDSKEFKVKQDWGVNDINLTLYMPRRLRISSDITQLGIPKEIENKVNEDGFWQTPVGGFIKDQILENFKKIGAVYLGFINGKFYGFRCIEPIKQLYKTLNLKEKGLKITRVVITDKLEDGITFALGGTLTANGKFRKCGKCYTCQEEGREIEQKWNVHYKPSTDASNSKGEFVSNMPWKYEVGYKNGEPYFGTKDVDFEKMLVRVMSKVIDEEVEKRLSQVPKANAHIINENGNLPIAEVEILSE